MRCVVTSLTEDGPSDLAEELARGEALQVYDHSPHEVDAENWQTWTPDPVDADPCKSKSGVLAGILVTEGQILITKKPMGPQR